MCEQFFINLIVEYYTIKNNMTFWRGGGGGQYSARGTSLCNLDLFTKAIEN